MKLVVWKYPLRLVSGPQSVEMPEGARIISTHMQGEAPTVCALCNPYAPLAVKKFIVLGTGEFCSSALLDYAGTCYEGDTRFVWHVFEVLK